MTMLKEHIPHSISQYVTKHFHEDFLFSCHQIKTPKGNVFYDVEVSKDDITHQLMFDQEGRLMQENYEENFQGSGDE